MSTTETGPKKVATQEFTGEQVAKRMLFLAYEASGAMGLGWLHAHNRTAEDDLWGKCSEGDGRVFADYVDGRMMKVWGLRYTADAVVFSDNPLRRDYQSWCGKYPTYEALANAAIESLRASKP